MSALQKLHDAADTLLAEVESGGSYKVTREALRKALDDADAVLKAPASSAEPVTDDELAEVERLDREATKGPWERTLVGVDWAVKQPGTFGHVTATSVEYRADADFIAASRTLLPKMAASERANRRSLDEANATLKRVTAERDDFETRAALLRTAAKASAAAERDRVRRLFDHHLLGRVVDDDTQQRLEAFARDLASGVDRRPA